MDLAVFHMIYLLVKQGTYALIFKTVKTVLNSFLGDCKRNVNIKEICWTFSKICICLPQDCVLG